MTTFGELVYRYRVRQKLTMRQLRARTGVSCPHISLVERGLRHPARRTVQTLARGLGIDLNEALLAAGYPAIGPSGVSAVSVPVYAAPPSGDKGEDTIPPETVSYLPADEVAGRALYYLRVPDDAMCDVGVRRGDLVLIDASTTEPRPGQLVVARVRNESLLRSWYPLDEGIMLRSANLNYPDLQVAAVKVLGVAIGFYAKL
jgi:SOS-response transcriptional repressor LexA